MGFLTKIKENIIFSDTEKKERKSQRKKEFFNIQAANTIGILFDLNNIYNFDAVNKFRKELIGKGKSVKFMGFIASPKISQNDIAQQLTKHIVLYSNKDIKSKKNDAVNAFINKSFDLLLVLNNNNSVATHYIANLSNAHCKVGALSSCQKALDFVIQPQSNMTTDELIKQIKKYLTSIKKTKKC